MADEMDRAAEREDLARAEAIAAQLRKAPPVKAVARGYCLNCFEDFEEGSSKIYCDAGCAEQHAIKLKRR